jgi:hypothetical protein
VRDRDSPEPSVSVLIEVVNGASMESGALEETPPRLSTARSAVERCPTYTAGRLSGVGLTTQSAASDGVSNPGPQRQALRSVIEISPTPMMSFVRKPHVPAECAAPRKSWPGNDHLRSKSASACLAMSFASASCSASPDSFAFDAMPAINPPVIMQAS